MRNEVMEDEDEEEYDEQDFDPSNPEHLCVKCGTRERIVNQVCGMCSELHPNTV